MQKSTEEWKDVRGYEGFYQVSSFGRIRSLERVVLSKNGSTRKSPGRILSQRINSSGYKGVSLSKKGHVKCFHSHRLIAEAFIENDNNKDYINHIDGNKLNTNVENLEWCTAKENSMHANKKGLINHAKGMQKPESKLIDSDITEIRDLYANGIFKQKKLGDLYGVHQVTISTILRKVAWSHI